MVAARQIITETIAEWHKIDAVEAQPFRTDIYGINGNQTNHQVQANNQPRMGKIIEYDKIKTTEQTFSNEFVDTLELNGIERINGLSTSIPDLLRSSLVIRIAAVDFRRRCEPKIDPAAVFIIFQRFEQ